MGVDGSRGCRQQTSSSVFLQSGAEIRGHSFLDYASRVVVSPGRSASSLISAAATNRLKRTVVVSGRPSSTTYCGTVGGKVLPIRLAGKVVEAKTSFGMLG